MQYNGDMGYLSALNLGQYISSDFVGRLANGYGLFAILFLIITFLYSISIGRTRAMISLLSIYAAYTLTLLFPYSRQLQERLGTSIPTYLMQAGLFFVLYGIVLFILNDSIRSRLSIGDIGPWEVLVMSILQIGLLSSIMMDFIPVEALPSGLALIIPYVVGSTARFLWAAASVAVFLFIKGRRQV